MNWWQFLLFPFAIIYDLITRCRNWLFDVGLLKSSSFDRIFTISVGNLAVGGTGKTPMVEYIIRLGIKEGWEMATLSRGYGRSSTGVQIATESSSPSQLGDESSGYFDQFGENIKVVVAESRVEGMRKIGREFPTIDVVILDDAFQHRQLKTDFSIVLTVHKRPFWVDYLMPSGRLREARKGYKRSDQVIVTKCPKKIEPQFGKNQLAKKPIAHSEVEYADFVKIKGSEIKSVIALAGIANNEDFFEYVGSNYELKASLPFADHYSFTITDVNLILKTVNKYDACLVCTYKDYVKLSAFREMDQIAWGYVPIQVKFLNGEKELLETLKTRRAMKVNTNLES